ncbi:MAG TPA: metal-dependent transcriptional regulator [Candidatus Lokiarchaeia archaeon]|nr:metal-dependent transcriptional regulator [Candidatus Lokiarchaeia archaeon]
MIKKPSDDKAYSTESYQEYLEAILRILNSKKEENQGDFISNIEIAQAMKIKPPSVTEFLAKLQKEGLIEWEKRKGVKLTQKGYELASRVLNMHRLLEKFFSVVLELDDTGLKHRVACDLEHDLIEEPKLVKALERSIEKIEGVQGAQE